MMKTTKIKIRIKRIIYTVVSLILILGLLITVFPKNAVRATMAIEGAPFSAALKCNPKYSQSNSKAFKVTIYTIPLKYSFTDMNGFKVSMFDVRSYLWVFHIAYPTQPEF